MATATKFELRTIRRHLALRWLVWIAFIPLVNTSRSLLISGLALFGLGVFCERQWPLPGVRWRGWTLPSNLLMWAIAAGFGWSVACKAVPALRAGDALAACAEMVLVVLFLCSQVQLARGKGLA